MDGNHNPAGWPKKNGAGDEHQPCPSVSRDHRSSGPFQTRHRCGFRRESLARVRGEREPSAVWRFDLVPQRQSAVGEYQSALLVEFGGLVAGWTLRLIRSADYHDATNSTFTAVHFANHGWPETLREIPEKLMLCHMYPREFLTKGTEHHIPSNAVCSGANYTVAGLPATPAR